MLLHDTLNGHVPVDLKRLLHFFTSRAFVDKLYARSAAAHAAYLDDCARDPIFIQYLNGVVEAYVFKVNIEILAVDLAQQRHGVLDAWQQDIHVIFIEKRTKIVKIYLVPLGVVIMQIAADIVGVKFTGLVCVYLHPLGLHNARVPDILPGLLDGGKLIVGQRLHFPCVVDIPVENVLCLLLTLYRR